MCVENLLRLVVVAAFASFLGLGESSQALISELARSDAESWSESPRLNSRLSAGVWSTGKQAADLAQAGARAERKLGELAAALPSEVRQQLTPELFADIAAHGDRFLESYPAQENWFLGMGRSPHPLLAYVEAKEVAASVHYMPFSNGSKLQKAKQQLPYVLRDRPLTPEQAQMASLEKRLVKHFVAHLPTPEELGDRSLTLVDFSVSGNSLVVARELLTRAAKERGIPERQIKVVALQPPPGYARIGINYRWGTDRFQLVESLTQWTTDQYFPTLFNGIAHRTTWRKETAPVGRFDVMTLEQSAGLPAERYEGLLDWMRLELAQRGN